jgi:ribosomal protein S18 acetylase RimI-like enzyme
VVYRSAKRKIDYDLDIRAMTATDLGQAHQLSIEVGWPHRPEDWRLVFSLGHGVIACDAIGRALGSAMWWPYGEGLASVGMVITSPRMQAQGSGRRLMDLIFAETGTRDLRLNSTRAGYRLYRSLGFQPIGRIFQHQGRPTVLEAAPDSDGPTLRAATAADLPALIRLDTQGCGADRSPAIAALLAVSVGIVAERDDQAVGFSLCRPFGRGHVVGPIVAEDDATAIALTRPHVAAHEGDFLRVDTAQEHGAFGAFLEACGLTMYDTVTPMIRGTAHAGTGPARTFGLVNQALG